MKLYMVTDHDRWGHSLNVVRADSPEAAQRLVAPNSKRITCEELPLEGAPSIVWCQDTSPDTPDR